MLFVSSLQGLRISPTVFSLLLAGSHGEQGVIVAFVFSFRRCSPLPGAISCYDYPHLRPLVERPVQTYTAAGWHHVSTFSSSSHGGSYSTSPKNSWLLPTVCPTRGSSFILDEQSFFSPRPVFLSDSGVHLCKLRSSTDLICRATSFTPLIERPTTFSCFSRF